MKIHSEFAHILISKWFTRKRKKDEFAKFACRNGRERNGYTCISNYLMDRVVPKPMRVVRRKA